MIQHEWKPGAITIDGRCCIKCGVTETLIERNYVTANCLGRQLPLKLEWLMPGDSRAVDFSEAINHPIHYGGDTPYETIKVLEAWLQIDEFIGFLKGNTIKYLSRHRAKGQYQDIQKASFYQKYLDNFMGKLPKGPK